MDEKFRPVLVAAVGAERKSTPTIWKEPKEPRNGVAYDYAALVALLAKARADAGLSADELDAAAEWQSGLTAALEAPQAEFGSCAVYERFNTWLLALGVGLKVVPIA